MIIKLTNQNNELPSFLMTDKGLKLFGNIQHGDVVQIEKESVDTLIEYLNKIKGE